MKEKRWLDINNDFVKILFRVMKENDLYKTNYIDRERYKNCCKSYSVKDSIYAVMNLPNALLTTNMSLENYYVIHAQYLLTIVDCIYSKLIRKLYNSNMSEEDKEKLKKNKHKIKKEALELIHSNLDKSRYSFLTNGILNSINYILKKNGIKPSYLLTIALNTKCHKFNKH